MSINTGYHPIVVFGLRSTFPSILKIQFFFSESLSVHTFFYIWLFLQRMHWASAVVRLAEEQNLPSWSSQWRDSETLASSVKSMLLKVSNRGQPWNKLISLTLQYSSALLELNPNSAGFWMNFECRGEIAIGKKCGHIALYPPQQYG